MEVPGGIGILKKVAVALYELAGTALFVYGILVSGGNPIGVPMTLLACILIFGGVTGGHFNPAVSIGVWCTTENKSQNAVFLLIIMLAQFIGAFIGVGLSFVSLYLVSNGEYLIKKLQSMSGDYVIETPPFVCPSDMVKEMKGGVEVETQVCDNTDGTGFHYNFQAIFTQVICTFIFVSVILMVKDKATAPTSDGVLGALTVALTLAGMIQVAMRLGPVFNPAVSVAFTTLDAWQTENPNKIYTHYTYAYTIGPALGGLLAGIFHQVHRKAFISDDEEELFEGSKRGLIEMSHDN